MIRKITCLILLAALLLSVPVCIPVQATATASGTFGRPNLQMEWSVEGNTLYITGNGFMDGFSAKESRPWDPYREQIQRVVMTGSIDNVASYAFVSCTALTEIVWPEGLKYINNSAFLGCSSLKELVVPEQVEIIYASAFAGCTALETVTMSESVLELYELAFSGCVSLHTVTLSPKLQSISRWCFQSCTALKEIRLPKTLRKLGDAAFRESGLQKIVIPERVEALPIGLFANCADLQEITILNNKTPSIPNSFVAGCKSLKTLHLPAGITSVKSDAFVGCDSLEGVYFYGDMPQITLSYVKRVSVTFYYPENNTTWTQEKIKALQNGHNGTITCLPFTYQLQDEPVPEPTEQTPPTLADPEEPTDAPVSQPTTEPEIPVTPESTQATQSAPEPTVTQDEPEAPPKQTKSWHIIAVVAVVVVVADGIVGALYIRKKHNKKKQTEQEK